MVFIRLPEKATRPAKQTVEAKPDVRPEGAAPARIAARLRSIPVRRKKPRESPNRRWRDYQTTAGNRPVKEFWAGLSEIDAAAVAAGMKDVQVNGLSAAKHLRGPIYEVIAPGDRQSYRLLFASEGEQGQVLLALDAFSKKTPRTPTKNLELAVRRLADWRARGR
jgi:phage-related protein